MKELSFVERREVALLDFLLATLHTCDKCPLSEDRGLGRGRLICHHKDKVVMSHHTPNTDCMDSQGQYAWEKI